MEALLASCGVWVCAAAGEKYTNPNGTSGQPEIDFQPAASASISWSDQSSSGRITKSFGADLEKAPIGRCDKNNQLAITLTPDKNFPSPDNKHPMDRFPQVCFIKNTVNNPNIVVGDYTYYDDPDDSENFERNVLYHFPFIGDKLIIGKFCAIARGAKFIMNGANHKLSGISTYPFQIFGNGWEKVMPKPGDLPYKGDTVIGNDVWIGYEALIMPGVKIGNGAIISSRSVVVSDVPAYTVVGGNPAKTIKQRFEPNEIAALEKIAWWDWPVQKITDNLEMIVAGDILALEATT